MAPPALLALDLGGVLVEVQKSALSPLGSPAVVQTAFFAGPRHDLLTIGHLDADSYLAQAARVLGVSLARVEDHWADMVDLAAPGRAILARLSTSTRAGGPPVVLWSNTDPVHWAALAPALLPHIDEARCALSFRVGKKKPDEAYFEVALARAGAAAGQVLFVDDREENVAAARAAGILAHHADGPDALERLLAAHDLL
jgi:FMN phosphatase YigB (HAD superfamily)